MIAICSIRSQPHYRRDAFITGLERTGYKIVQSGAPESSADILCIWNRHGGFESMADAWEAKGGTVLVAENGYVGVDEHGRQYYAISAHGHCGSGWYPKTEGRFKKLGIEVKPWRADGEHILVTAQRGIGSKTMASPFNWHEKTATKLRSLINRPVKIRLHPGNHAPTIPLEDDLRGAWACSVWSSSSGVKALIAGVPVTFSAPYFIAERCAVRLEEINQLLCDDGRRLQALENVAQAQWSVEEIEAGIPFRLFQDRLA